MDQRDTPRLAASPDLDDAPGAAVAQGPEAMADWSPRRRSFLRMLGYGGGVAAFGGLLPGCSSSNASTPAEDARAAVLAQNPAFWQGVQERFILNPGRRFMNVGTAGAMPREVVEKFNADNIDYATEARNGYSNFLTERTAIARGAGVAANTPYDPQRGMGIDPDELALSYNTSDGMCQAILGLPWNRGDVVVTTNMEHPGGDVPLAIARDRYGIEIRRVTLPTGAAISDDVFVDLFSRAIDTVRAEGKTVRALMWSSPIYLTGTILPNKRLVQLAVQKSAGQATPIVTICDGAHLPGMMAYDYADQGMDFMSSAGHKWQCGPGSTGLLVIRNKVRAAANPLPLPDWFPNDTSSYPQTGLQSNGQPWFRRGNATTAPYDIGSVVTSLGSKHTPLLKGLANACAIWDGLGRKNIETYVLSLANYLRQRVAAEFGDAALYSPRNPAPLNSALTLINPFGDARIRTTTQGTVQSPSNRLVTALGQAGFVVRNTTVPVLNAGVQPQLLGPNVNATPAALATNEFPLRISTHLWHDADDVDALIAAIKQLVPTIT